MTSTPQLDDTGEAIDHLVDMFQRNTRCGFCHNGKCPHLDNFRFAVQELIRGELERHRTFSLDVAESDDYKRGFADALDQYGEALTRQAAALSAGEVGDSVQ